MSMSKALRKINTANLIEILKMSQEEVKEYVYSELKLHGYQPIFADGFVYAKGDIPIAMVSHMDTVCIPPKFIKYQSGVMSGKYGLGADDRAGIYSILHLIRLGLRPHVIFTEDEEIGCIGAEKFASTAIRIDDLKYVIELDRRGSKDAVFYDCDNPDFTDYVTSFGFVETYGSFSDICEICPKLGVAGVNLSIGYYNEHTSKEQLVISDMARTIRLVEKMLMNPPTYEFEYIELQYSYSYRSSYNADNVDEYMACYGYTWSTTSGQYVKKGEDDEKESFDDSENRYPLLISDCWIVMENGDLIEVDDAPMPYYIEEDGTLRDGRWQEVDGYMVDYNFLPLDYQHFYDKRYF